MPALRLLGHVLCHALRGDAVIAAKATPYHEEHYLRAIAEGRHITSLALSEAGTGVHFYLPQTALERDGRHFVLRGTKHFVTNGGHADSYVVSTRASTPEAENGDFSCLVVDRDATGMTWTEPWRGFGMHGNASCGVRLDGVRVPEENLLGAEGDQVWYVFEVVTPYFLMAMAATYIGIAQSALDFTLQHLRTRTHEHAASALAEVPALQHKVAEMWMAVEKARGLTYQGAKLGDLGDAGAMAAIMAAKIDAVTGGLGRQRGDDSCGGIAYEKTACSAACCATPGKPRDDPTLCSSRPAGRSCWGCTALALVMNGVAAAQQVRAILLDPGASDQTWLGVVQEVAAELGLALTIAADAQDPALGLASPLGEAAAPK